MKDIEIKEAFFKAIQEKAIYKKLQGISDDKIYNWLNDRQKPTVGDMINVLHQLGYLELKLIKEIPEPRLKNKVNVSIE